jgi:hypothetical protein
VNDGQRLGPRIEVGPFALVCPSGGFDVSPFFFVLFAVAPQLSLVLFELRSCLFVRRLLLTKSDLSGFDLP